MGTVSAAAATPRLTDHARQRCVEMGISTGRVKRVVADPDVSYPGGREHANSCRVAYRGDDPAIAVVYFTDDDEVPVVASVLWRTAKTYTRPETVDASVAVST